MAYPTEVNAVVVAPAGNLGTSSPTHRQSHDQYRTALLSIKDKIDSMGVGGSSPSKTVSTTTYTLIAGDKGLTLKFTNASAVAVTVPSSVLAAGDIVGWEQWGTGAVTFAGGATLRSLGNLLSSAGQYSAGSIRFDTATEALVAGALT